MPTSTLLGGLVLAVLVGATGFVIRCLHRQGATLTEERNKALDSLDGKAQATISLCLRYSLAMPTNFNDVRQVKLFGNVLPTAPGLTIIRDEDYRTEILISRPLQTALRDLTSLEIEYIYCVSVCVGIEPWPLDLHLAFGSQDARRERTERLDEISSRLKLLLLRERTKSVPWSSYWKLR